MEINDKGQMMQLRDTMIGGARLCHSNLPTIRDAISSLAKPLHEPLVQSSSQQSAVRGQKAAVESSSQQSAARRQQSGGSSQQAAVPIPCYIKIHCEGSRRNRCEGMGVRFA